MIDDKVKLRRNKGKIEAFCFDCDKWKDETKCIYFKDEGYICLRCLDKKSKNKEKTITFK